MVTIIQQVLFACLMSDDPPKNPISGPQGTNQSSPGSQSALGLTGPVRPPASRQQ